jgi:hypothetical protein
VKNFNDKNVDRTTRGWRGIGLRKDPIVVSEGSCCRAKTPANKGGVKPLCNNFLKIFKNL